jgi:hypothetical protein
MWDILVHAQDIAIPLGIDFATPPDAGAAAATRIWELRWPFSFRAKRRLGSCRLTATDVAWTIGTGAEITGPISAILLLPPDWSGGPVRTGPGWSRCGLGGVASRPHPGLTHQAPRPRWQRCPV